MTNSKERQGTEKHGKDYHGVAINKILNRRPFKRPGFSIVTKGGGGRYGG